MATTRNLARSASRFVISHPMPFFCLAWLIVIIFVAQSAPQIDDLPDSAQLVYATVRLFGYAGLTYIIFYRGLVANEGVLSTLSIVVERGTFLAAGLLFVRMFGAELAEALVWVRKYPDAAMAVVAGVALVRVIFAFSPSRSFISARANADFRYAAGGDRIARGEKDIHRTAVHEAGHLMMFADLPELPAELAVKVLAEIGCTDKFRGHVSHSTEAWPVVRTEGFLRWLMLMHLAGSEAEFVIFGGRADGAEGDNRDWLHAATSYLSAGFGEVFYSEPIGAAQTAHNRAVLNDLKAAHVADLGRFFAANTVVLRDLAAAVTEKKAMAREEIAPYLLRVVKMPETGGSHRENSC